MYWNNGSYYKGEWKDGLQTGRGELYIPKQGVKRGQFYENQLVDLEVNMQLNPNLSDAPLE